MCHSWTFNRINNIHHRVLRILYQDKKSSFEKLLMKDKSVCPYRKFTVFSYRDIFKVKNSLSPIIMIEAFNFQENESCNLSKSIHLASRNMHPTHFSTDTISSWGPNLWKLISGKIKYASILLAFKAKSKSWTISNCPD